MMEEEEKAYMAAPQHTVPLLALLLAMSQLPCSLLQLDEREIGAVMGQKSVRSRFPSFSLAKHKSVRQKEVTGLESKYLFLFCNFFLIRMHS